MLCPLHVSSKLPNETTESLEERKSRVSIRQTQKQCNEILKPDTKAHQKWNLISNMGNMVLYCSALTLEERVMCERWLSIVRRLPQKKWFKAWKAETPEQGNG